MRGGASAFGCSLPMKRCTSAIDVKKLLGKMIVEFFSTEGRLVVARAIDRHPAGEQAVPFAIEDGAGRALPSGPYLYRIVTPDGAATGRLTVVR